MKEKIMSALAVIFALAIALNPTETVLSAQQAMKICTNSLVPSLFPFFVCTFFMVELGTLTSFSKKLSGLMKPLFGVSGAGALPFVMGVVGGYPVGAKICAKLKEAGDLSEAEAEKLLAFCNNSGPLFVLGAVGSGMAGNAKVGLCLYISHIIAALTVVLFMHNGKCDTVNINSKLQTHPEQKKISIGSCLGKCIGDAAENTVKICGFVIIFKILMGILEKLIQSKTVILALYCVLEVSGACAAAAESMQGNQYLMCAVISAIIGWSGVSVHMQVASAVASSGLRLKKYFIGKLIMTAVSPVYTLILMPIICKKTETTVFAPQLTQAYVFGIGSAVICVGVAVVIVTLAAALISRNKFSNNY